MICSDCQYQARCFSLLQLLHRCGYPCDQGRYLKGRGEKQITLADVPEVTA